jgi:RNA polymerase sigma-B factor
LFKKEGRELMMQQTEPYPRSKEEIYQFIKEFQVEGCRNAQRVLVEQYKNLVQKLARKYSKGRDSHEDILQVGMIGLLGAIRRYDQTYGKSFEAFAIPTVVGEIKRFLRDKTWSVHVPRRIKELGPKIKKAVDELTPKLRRTPKAKEIADYLKVPEKEILEAMEMSKSYNALSMDYPLEVDSEGSAVTLLDVVGNTENGYERVNQRLTLKKALRVLDEREYRVITYLFHNNMNQKEVGKKLGISQMHVSRIRRKALNKLHKALNAAS